jgi:hypothetical protein
LQTTLPEEQIMPAPSNYIVSGHVHGDADKAEIEVIVNIGRGQNKDSYTTKAVFDADRIITGWDLSDFDVCAEKIKNAIPEFSDCTECHVEERSGSASTTNQFEKTIYLFRTSSFWSGYRDLIITFVKVDAIMHNAPVTKLSPNERMVAATSGDLSRQEELLNSIRGMMAILIFLALIIAVAVVWQLLVTYHPEGVS